MCYQQALAYRNDHVPNRFHRPQFRRHVQALMMRWLQGFSKDSLLMMSDVLARVDHNPNP